MMCEHNKAMGNLTCPVCTEEREAERVKVAARLLALEKQARRQKRDEGKATRPVQTKSKGWKRTFSPSWCAKRQAKAKAAKRARKRNR